MVGQNHTVFFTESRALNCSTVASAAPPVASMASSAPSAYGCILYLDDYRVLRG